ncbi:MAG: sialate O-acetylesterase [Gammaproteobacteria bacterium]|nr:sialate O-acetylesterase [Gammaproteobacteria bacterium]MBU1724870.1 sialate O-acetylesterase [Gammaproteobacteria bacterium]MBU2005054.1 sialate O-acetylesterase [Gammaproteobacteria bacterium]
MRLFQVLLVAALCLPSASLWAKDHIIILAGQSNMMGRGKTFELPAAYKKTPANVQFFYQGRERKLAQFAYFGPEVSFAHEVARAFPNDNIILVKQAASGSRIKQWQPGQSLYQGLLRQVGFATDDKQDAPIDAILWMQGESDAQSNLHIASQYGGQLRQLANSLRTDLQSPHSLFIFGQTSLDHPASQASLDAVRQQQQAMQQALANSSMITTDGLGKMGDGIHLNAAGQIELGRRFAKTYLDQTRQ